MGRQLWEAPASGGGGVSSQIFFLKINATSSKKTWNSTSSSVCHPEPLIAQACRASRQCGAESWVLGDPVSHLPPHHYGCAPRKVASLHRKARGSQYVGLCPVPWGSMDHTEGVGGVQSGELFCNHGSQIQGRQGDKENREGETSYPCSRYAICRGQRHWSQAWGRESRQQPVPGNAIGSCLSSGMAPVSPAP